MDTLVEGLHGTGGMLDKYDSRDYKFETVAAGAFNWMIGYDIEIEMRGALNVPFFRMPVKDQGTSFSCGGQAWAYYGAVLEALSTNSIEERSAKFIYAQTFVPGGGSAGRPNCDIVVNQGWAEETVLPSYENGNPPTEPFMEKATDITSAVRGLAAKAKAMSYWAVNTDIESIAMAIEAGHGCLIGIDGSNNGTWSTANPKPPETTEWRHWVYAGKARLNGNKKQIGILNSWGASVGEQGWQWLDAEYFSSGHVWQGWTILFKSDVFTHEFDRDLFIGDENEEVKALQEALKIDGEFPDWRSTTGYYGPITQQAVKQFQRKYGVASLVELLFVRGRKVGPKTRAKLNELFSK